MGDAKYRKQIWELQEKLWDAQKELESVKQEMDTIRVGSKRARPTDWLTSCSSALSQVKEWPYVRSLSSFFRSETYEVKAVIEGCAHMINMSTSILGRQAPMSIRALIYYQAEAHLAFSPAFVHTPIWYEMNDLHIHLVFKKEEQAMKFVVLLRDVSMGLGTSNGHGGLASASISRGHTPIGSMVLRSNCERGDCMSAAFDTCGILTNILEFVGNTQWLYVAGVSRRWKVTYRAVAGGDTGTLFRCAAASISRLQLACSTCQVASPAAVGDNAIARDISLATGQHGSKEVLLWAKDHRWLWNIFLCNGTARAGQLKILIFLHQEYGAPWNSASVAREAAAGGHVHTLEWLWHQPDGRWKEGDGVCIASARGGWLGCLKWMAAQKCLWDEAELPLYPCLCAIAAEGPLPSTSIKRSLGHSVDPRSSDSLVTSSEDHHSPFAVVEWLYHNGFPSYHILVSEAAARGGNVALLLWLRTNGCICDLPGIVYVSLQRDRLSVLEGLLEQRLIGFDEFDVGAMLKVAGLSGSLVCCQWLRDHNAPWPDQLFSVDPIDSDSDDSADSSDLSGAYMFWPVKTLEWAIKSGCPWGIWPPRLCRYLYAYWDKETCELSESLRWAHGNGCPCTDCEEDKWVGKSS